ncbi:uncharacterized protein CEXT_382231 [Caerostris extrusa]|uniref:Uncharacterized protein n=1 Tax=Caerostris extrusa TaxID=172846 RepID=A0AAV4N7Q0_CAEEX|nr:uncharacterized protein CEXT_382231 [Caerostris extrusa]
MFCEILFTCLDKNFYSKCSSRNVMARRRRRERREIPNKKDALAYLGEEMPNILVAGKKWWPSVTDDSCGVTQGRHDGSACIHPPDPSPIRPAAYIFIAVVSTRTHLFVWHGSDLWLFKRHLDQ